MPVCRLRDAYSNHRFQLFRLHLNVSNGFQQFIVPVNIYLGNYVTFSANHLEPISVKCQDQVFVKLYYTIQVYAEPVVDKKFQLLLLCLEFHFFMTDDIIDK